MSTLYLIPPEVIDVYWPIINKYLDRSRGKRPSMSMEFLAEAAAQGHMQLWAAYDDQDVFGAGATEIVAYPNFRVVCVRLWSADAGRREDWFALLSAVEEWARTVGASGVEVAGRDGWVKVLARQGYDLTNIIVRKMLDEPERAKSAA